MEGGFKAADMWSNKEGTIYETDKWAQIDAIAVIMNRLKVIMMILYVIVLVVSFIVGLVVVRKIGV